MRLTRGVPHPALAGILGGYADFAEVTVAPRETREAAVGGVVVIVDLDRAGRSRASGSAPSPAATIHAP